MFATCKHCKNIKYSIINGATTNLWGHLKREHSSLLSISTSQTTLNIQFNTKNIKNKDISKEFTEESFKQWMAEWIIFEDLPFTIIEGCFKPMIEKALEFKIISADTIQHNASNNNTMIDNIESWAIEQNIDFSEKNHFCCFAHVLNLAVQAGLKQLKEEIDQIQNIILKCHSSPQRQSDWVSLEHIAAFLKRFAKLSTEMCSSFYPTISAVYPIYNHLMNHAEKRINNTQISNKISKTAKATWDKLQEYYNKTFESFYYIATILDP
ncbi:12358_t:CDS:2 [Cetraspora pellucida]|uniref:12358_t:CDS:1 n=1 Tax=Cetraspora pellucida TaxID=1433469 RepID=A0ACA9MUL9_9GLOM|nr:12358_t:CDS:2 [Cetraspora pellucida]